MNYENVANAVKCVNELDDKAETERKKKKIELEGAIDIKTDEIADVKAQIKGRTPFFKNFIWVLNKVGCVLPHLAQIPHVAVKRGPSAGKRIPLYMKPFHNVD